MNRWLVWPILVIAAPATLAAVLWMSAPPATRAGGPTNVSGTISSNTTWTLADSPYIVTGNVSVSQGATLTIEPGVTVKFDSLKALQVEGTLIARGTAGNPITFTSNAASPAKGDWVSIIFTDTSPDATFDDSGNYSGGSILEYCVVEYAGGGAGRYAAIRADSSAPFINHCTIRNNQSWGISASYADDSIFRITNNVIASSGGGVNVDIRAIISNNMISYTQGRGIIAFRNATVTNNGVSNNAGTGISFVLLSAGQTAHIGKNVVRANGGGGERDSGILAEGAGAMTISENIVLDNVGFSGAGVLILGGTVTVTNNLIVGNSGNTGGGISVGGVGTGAAPNARISNNSIVANTAATVGSGIYLYDLGTVVQANTLARNGRSPSAIYARRGSAGGTTISTNNLVDSTAAYEIENGNPSTEGALNATSNWWGTASEAAIQARILDQSDDISLGLVNYSPYLTSPNTAAPISPPTGLVLTPGAGTITLSWAANPEADTAGYKVYYDTDSGYPYTGTGALQGSSPIDVGNVSSYTLSGLPAGTYYLAITAYDASRDGTNDQTEGNESWFSQEVTGTLKIYLPLVARGFVGGW